MSLISPDNTATLWALIASGTATAIWLEQTYRWAAHLSGPVIALLIAMLLTNTRVMPAASPAYDFVGDWLVPLAIPLLLFRANLRHILRTGGRLFAVFHLSAIGTVIGTVIAVALLKGAIASPDLAHAAGIMTASYMGGGVNFMAVKESFDVAPEVSNPLIVADNFVMAGLFVALLAIASGRWFLKRFPHPETGDASSASDTNRAAEHWKPKPVALLDIARALAFAFIVIALATLAGRGIGSLFGDVTRASPLTQTLHLLTTNTFVLLTLVTVTLATLFHKTLTKIQGTDEIGAYLLLVFLFTLGLPADLVSVFSKAPLFFVFCGVIAVTNLVFTLAAGKLLKLNLEDLLISINANLGGAPTAAAMAISAGWPRLVLPALLVGVWGYVIGTPVGLLVTRYLLAN